MDQSTGVIPCRVKKAFACEKCLHPKKPAKADKGLGCGASKTKCLLRSISAFLLRALEPQSKKTIGFSRADKRDIT